MLFNVDAIFKEASLFDDIDLITSPQIIPHSGYALNVQLRSTDERSDEKSIAMIESLVLLTYILRC